MRPISPGHPLLASLHRLKRAQSTRTRYVLFCIRRPRTQDTRSAKRFGNGLLGVCPMLHIFFLDVHREFALFKH